MLLRTRESSCAWLALVSLEDTDHKWPPQRDTEGNTYWFEAQGMVGDMESMGDRMRKVYVLGKQAAHGSSMDLIDLIIS